MAPIDYRSFSSSGETPKQQDRRWWLASDADMPQAIASVVSTLVQADTARQTQYQTSARLYGNLSLMGASGLSLNRKSSAQGAVKERISYNVVQSGIDTVVSKMAKNKPKPLYLTSGGDYKLQRRAKKLDKFTDGQFYENHAYDLGILAFRDGMVFGDGVVHVFEKFGRVAFERVLASELFVDQMEAFYGDPRQLHRVKNVDRDVLLELFPENKADILMADPARSEFSSIGQVVSDQVTVAESWHLPSGPDATDGLHVISLPKAVLFKEPWKRKRFPFAFFQWTPRLYGFWGQGAAEQVQNIQLEVNKILWVIQRSMHLAGSRIVLVERGSKMAKEHFTNELMTILDYTGTPPQFVVPPIIPPEYYQHLQTLKAQAFEQLGVSQLSATSQKPAGLNSGKALREYQDIETERFMTAGQCYERLYLDLAELAIQTTQEIFEREKKYAVRMPGKKFLETIDWKDIDLEGDEYVMKVFPVSSLPNDPAGRLQTVQEYMQAGMIDPRAGRRLLDFPDLEQVDEMASAPEDWLHKKLEGMIEDGEAYLPEDDDDLQLAQTLTPQYINYGKVTAADEAHIQLLRDFLVAVNEKLQAMSQPQQPQGQPGQPQAVPQAPPTSDLLPNAPGAAPAA